MICAKVNHRHLRLAFKLILKTYNPELIIVCSFATWVSLM